jgi:predicted dehydrogenase
VRKSGIMINIAVIGLGYWGPNLVRNFNVPGRSKVLMVCDKDPARLSRAAEQNPGLRMTQSPEEVFRNHEIDAVAIATPVETHYELASAALAAGKHVFLEKPMTKTVEEGQRLLDLALRKERVLLIDHTFVYTPAVRRIKEIVAAGDLGTIYYYDSIRINLGLFQRDVNVLWDLAVHDLSILDYVLGVRPVAVSAVGISHVPGAPENVAYLSLFLPDNAVAHINVNWLAPVKVRQTLIGGSKRMIVYNDLEPSEKIKVYDRGVTVSDQPEELYKKLISYRTGDMWAPNLAPTEALHTEALHFISCVEGSETPITDGSMGLRLVSILELATQSIRKDGIPIPYSEA